MSDSWRRVVIEYRVACAMSELRGEFRKAWREALCVSSDGGEAFNAWLLPMLGISPLAAGTWTSEHYATGLIEGSIDTLVCYALMHVPITLDKGRRRPSETLREYVQACRRAGLIDTTETDDDVLDESIDEPWLTRLADCRRRVAHRLGPQLRPKLSELVHLLIKRSSAAIDAVQAPCPAAPPVVVEVVAAGRGDQLLSVGLSAAAVALLPRPSFRQPPPLAREALERLRAAHCGEPSEFEVDVWLMLQRYALAPRSARLGQN